MKVIIAGSRECGFEIADVSVAVERSGIKHLITEVVSGAAPGVDKLGEAWAKANYVTIKKFPADWDKYGRCHAGSKRNQQMADYADALIALWDGESTGTRDMIKRASIGGLDVYVFVFKDLRSKIVFNKVKKKN